MNGTLSKPKWVSGGGVWRQCWRNFVPGIVVVLLAAEAHAVMDGSPSALPVLGQGAASEAGQADEAQVEYDGRVTPGSTINLNLQGAQVPGARYEWVQVEGPPVEIANPHEASVRLVVPSESSRLGFLLTVTVGETSRRYRVNVPVQAPDAAATGAAPPAPPTSCLAKGGDDQIGLVGRRLTLDGSQSTPRRGLAIRWLQVSGPAAGSPRQDGPYYSFLPASPGVYRFALVVAAAGEISEPDYVTVTVGDLPPAAAGGTSGGVAPRADASRPTLEVALAGIGTLPGGPEAAAGLADAFGATASFSPPGAAFSAVQADLSTRCGAVVPADPSLRAAWTQAVLEPLSQYAIARLAPIGIDPRVPSTVVQPMTEAQRQQVNETLNTIAVALRTRSTTR